METPNGILLSEDETTLYLVDHNTDPGGARTLLEYRVDDAGKWHRTRTIFDWAPGYGGDGMVMDVEGNIYLTAGEREKAGVYVFAPDAALLEFIPTVETPGNCTFGGPDLRTLYIAASTSLYTIRAAIPGRLTFPPAKA
jgi:gluconolactonase